MEKREDDLQSAPDTDYRHHGWASDSDSDGQEGLILGLDDLMRRSEDLTPADDEAPDSHA